MDFAKLPWCQLCNSKKKKKIGIMYITYSKTAKLKRCGLGVTNHWTELLHSHIFYTFWGYICYVFENQRPSAHCKSWIWGLQEEKMHFSGHCKISNSAHADFLLVSNNLQLLFWARNCIAIVLFCACASCIITWENSLNAQWPTRTGGYYSVDWTGLLDWHIFGFYTCCGLFNWFSLVKLFLLH